MIVDSSVSFYAGFFRAVHAEQTVQVTDPLFSFAVERIVEFTGIKKCSGFSRFTRQSVKADARGDLRGRLRSGMWVQYQKQ